MRIFRKISTLSVNVLILSLCICSEAYAGNIFDTLSGKTIDFAIGLRTFAYVISSFGIVMFTFLAIGGKINFKHLSYIAISLFFMSGVGSLIDYVTGSSNMNLERKFHDTYKGAVCSSSLCRG